MTMPSKGARMVCSSTTRLAMSRSAWATLMFSAASCTAASPTLTSASAFCTSAAEAKFLPRSRIILRRASSAMARSRWAAAFMLGPLLVAINSALARASSADSECRVPMTLSSPTLIPSRSSICRMTPSRWAETSDFSIHSIVPSTTNSADDALGPRAWQRFWAKLAAPRAVAIPRDIAATFEGILNGRSSGFVKNFGLGRVRRRGLSAGRASGTGRSRGRRGRRRGAGRRPGGRRRS